MNERLVVSESELARQRDFAARVRALPERPRSFHVVTMGCQMNERDSETIAGMLVEMGLRPERVRERADLILYNTCCVRENAENKALGNVIWLKELKKDKPDLLICVGGCMTQEKGMAEAMKRNYPFIDLVYGTHNLYRLPEYLHRVLRDRAPVVEVVETDGEIVEGLPEARQSRFSAFVNIMYGCNNFCTYCIVPYVRGRERSREPEAVLEEALRLRDAGVQEITLLGQNVNSYRGGGAEFANLLYRLDRLEIPRIRFMTSHPKDLSDELIAAYGELKHLMPHLHLPVQAGDDEILRRMNRRYNREHYLDLVRRLRAARPDIGLTTDIFGVHVHLFAPRGHQGGLHARRHARRGEVPAHPDAHRKAAGDHVRDPLGHGRNHRRGAGGERLRPRRGLGRRQIAPGADGQFPRRRGAHRTHCEGQNHLRGAQHLARRACERINGRKSKWIWYFRKPANWATRCWPAKSISA